MEALVYDGVSQTISYVSDYPVPTLINDTDVIVKVAYSGVCGTDLHIIQGKFPVSEENSLPLGHEFSGEIYEAGKASIFKKGQKVVVDPNRACSLCDYCRDRNYQFCTGSSKYTIGIWQDGGWAQYVRAPQDQVFALPADITLEQAGLCEPYSCVSHGFDRAAPLSVGQKILIVGAGIIGNLWVTTLHHHGHRDVTVSEMNQNRLKIVERLDTGYRLISPDVLSAETIQYDVIIDCTGVAKVMESTFNYLNPGGKYVLFGCCSPNAKAQVNPFQIYNKELTIIGVKVNPFSFPKAIKWLSAMGDRYIDYHKLGVKTYSLSQYQDALKDLKAGNISKAVFKINS
ncbi:D-altritol 5-dehydrogenase-like [Achroia grisella]|uniref:D-altritol 5-dehydrogenase-like n=1 Tax=Achroia grisella TaxID=688607 RepID=UPI0027D2177E|nr:D-altritol 5-dehydrogenase-like [Achroia grisella]